MVEQCLFCRCARRRTFLFYNCVYRGSMILFFHISGIPDRIKRDSYRDGNQVKNMRKVALITDGWRRLFTYAWPAGILQRIKETGEDVNLYIFNSTGNWSRDAGYNRAEYNIFNLPDLSEFDGIILELNNISSPAVLAEVIHKAKQTGLPVVSIANELEDFYYVGIDNYSAMKQVIAHLYEVHDCRKFWLLVGAQSNYESSCRLQGMLDYAKEHKIKIDKDDI